MGVAGAVGALGILIWGTQPKIWPVLVSELFATSSAQFKPLLAIFRMFLAHIVELEGKKGLFVTGR